MLRHADWIARNGSEEKNRARLVVDRWSGQGTL